MPANEGRIPAMDSPLPFRTLEFLEDGGGETGRVRGKAKDKGILGDAQDNSKRKGRSQGAGARANLSARPRAEGGGKPRYEPPDAHLAVVIGEEREAGASARPLSAGRGSHQAIA